MKMNHFNNLVIFIFLPNMMAFLQLFIWYPMIYFIRQCLNKPEGYKGGDIKDFILKVLLNQVYIPYLGMKSLLNPDDIDQKEYHWNLKVYNACTLE